METIHVALATDENFVQHAGVMITSLLYNKKSVTPIVIHVLGEKLSKTSVSKIEEIIKKHEKATIIFYDIDTTQFKGLFTGFHKGTSGTTTYFKTIIPEILSDKISKVLYLDVDMVVRKDITELWNTNIDNYHLAAVEDYPIKIREILPLLKINLGIPKNESYFNAGLLLINLNKWREDDIGHKVLAFNRNNPDKLINTDQDGFNAILWSKWLHLDVKWNIVVLPLLIYNGRERNKISLEIIEGIKDPGIVHFAGSALMKPWRYRCPNPYAKEYWSYLKMTPWKDYSVSVPNNFNDWLAIMREYFKMIIIKSGHYFIAVKLYVKFKTVNRK